MQHSTPFIFLAVSWRKGYESGTVLLLLPLLLLLLGVILPRPPPRPLPLVSRAAGENQAAPAARRVPPAASVSSDARSASLDAPRSLRRRPPFSAESFPGL